MEQEFKNRYAIAIVGDSSAFFAKKAKSYSSPDTILML
jgi:hypothetical protein